MFLQWVETYFMKTYFVSNSISSKLVNTKLHVVLYGSVHRGDKQMGIQKCMYYASQLKRDILLPGRYKSWSYNNSFPFEPYHHSPCVQTGSRLPGTVWRGLILFTTDRPDYHRMPLPAGDTITVEWFLLCAPALR